MTYRVCCVTRDFEYINEWIEHYIGLNFDYITVYDHMSVKPVVYDHPKVIVKQWNKPHGIGCYQYNEHAKEYANEEGFSFYCDEDEWLVGKNITTIQEMMQPYLHYDALGLNWRIFSDRIDEGNTSTKLVEKYLYHAPDSWMDPAGHNYIKTIVKNDAVVKFIDAHYPILKPGKVNRGVGGNNIIGSITRVKDVTSSLWCDHYHFRGRQAYIDRQTRPIEGRATRTAKEVGDMYDSCINLCTQKRTV